MGKRIDNEFIKDTVEKIKENNSDQDFFSAIKICKKKTLQVTVDEMRSFAFAYVEKYAPSKQQLKTYLLKKYMKLSATDSRKKDVNKLIDIVLSDLEKNKFINDQFYSESKAKSMVQRGHSLVSIYYKNNSEENRPKMKKSSLANEIVNRIISQLN